MNSETTITSLTSDMIGEILKQLSYEETLKTGTVSRQFASLCCRRNYWKQRAFEDFKFPHELFDLALGDPRFIYREVRTYWRKPNNSLIGAVKGGFTLLIHYLMQHTSITDLMPSLIYAIDQGDIVLVQYFVCMGLTKIKEGHQIKLDFDLLTWFASLHSRLPIVEFILSVIPFQDRFSRRDILGEILSGGASGCDMKMVQYALQQGATDLNFALRETADYDQSLPTDGKTERVSRLQMAQFLVQRGATEFDLPLYASAKQGHLEMCQYFIQIGATVLDDTLVVASKRDT